MDIVNGKEAGMKTIPAKAKDRRGARAASPSRSFRLVDMLMLVAATAVGFWLSGVLFRSDESDFSWSSITEAWAQVFDPLGKGPSSAGSGHSPWVIAAVISETVVACMPMLAAWTVMVLMIRLFGPRPPLRRLSRQPGFAALFASGLPLFVMAGCFVLGCALIGWEGATDRLLIEEISSILVPISTGMAVLVGWSSLIIGRRWRAEASWCDRLGRILGIYWFVVCLNSVALFLGFAYPFQYSFGSTRPVKAINVPINTSGTTTSGRGVILPSLVETFDCESEPETHEGVTDNQVWTPTRGTGAR